jgi:hypothetical protein
MSPILTIFKCTLFIIIIYIIILLHIIMTYYYYLHYIILFGEHNNVFGIIINNKKIKIWNKKYAIIQINFQAKYIFIANDY